MRDFAAPHSRAVGSVLSVLLVAAALSGCVDPKKDKAPPCPPVYILSDAAHITKFRSGAGRDLTDVEFEGEIVGYKGECSYDAKGAIVDLLVSFELKRGPAASGRTVDISYFVAIPKFYPIDEAKAVMAAQAVFPDGTETMRVTDDGVAMRIPVKDKELIDQYEIYLGFQTSSEELEMNRRMKR
jgi:hypothetical protein